MGFPKLAPILSEDASSPRPLVSLGGEAPWLLLGGLGVALALVGGADLLLAWFPFGFGNPEWEFGTVSSTFDGLPVLAMGSVLLLGGAIVRQSRWAIRGVSLLHAGLGLLLLGAALLYATDVPLALQSIKDPMLRIGLLKAIAKTTVQMLVYPPLFFWVAVQGWRQVPVPREVKS
jgi:hypothetical protein